MVVYETDTIKPTAKPSNSYYKFKWSSSDDSIVSVTKGNANKAELKANKTGTVVITATTYNGVSAQATVTVVNAPQSISLGESSITVVKGETCKLTPDIGEDCASASTAFTSGNTKVATVDANGNVKAVATGRAVITVTTYNGKSAVIVINVVEKAAEPVSVQEQVTETYE